MVDGSCACAENARHAASRNRQGLTSDGRGGNVSMVLYTVGRWVVCGYLNSLYGVAVSGLENIPQGTAFSETT